MNKLRADGYDEGEANRRSSRRSRQKPVRSPSKIAIKYGIYDCENGRFDGIAECAKSAGDEGDVK